MTISTLRVGQINILNKEEDRVNRYLRLIRHLHAEGIEAVTIQEVTDTKKLERELTEAGFPYVIWGTPFKRRHDPEPDSVGIASKYPLNIHGEVEHENERNSLIASIVLPGRDFYICSAHFAWGSFAEGVRLLQAQEIDYEASLIMNSNPNAVFILGGDLNTPENSRTLRYFFGLDLNYDFRSTYWVDAHSEAGKTENWATTDQGKGTLGPATAIRFEILYPEFMPARRIDFLLTRGWVYGKPGYPINFGRFGEPQSSDDIELSDHFGIWADYILGSNE